MPDKRRQKGNVMNELGKGIVENVIFFAEFAGIVVGMILIAYLYEKAVKKKNKSTERILTTRKIAMIGMLSAISGILMMIAFPLPFAPAFYTLDLSELPVLIGAFAFGPLAGVMIELCKVVIHMFISGTSSAFVGDLANFVVGSSFVIPAAFIYLHKKTKRSALEACIAGTLVMTAVGTWLNAVYLLPKYAQMFGMPLESLVAMGTAVNPNINGVGTFVVLAVAPFNLLKGALVSVITVLIYKKISPLLKTGHLH